MTRPSLSDYGTYGTSAYMDQWSGVIGAWCPSLGPTGLRLHDFSRRANWGTLNNMDAATDWIVDAGRYVIDVDGSNDFIDMGDPTSLETPLVTFSLWCRPRTTNQSPFSTIAGKEWSTPRTSPFVSYKFGANFSSNASGPYSFEINVNGTNRSIAATFGPSAGRLDFLCGTYDGATIRFYVNGVLNNSASHSGVIQYSNGPFRIGANATGGELYNGNVDDILVSDRALSAAEVWERYLLGPAGIYQRRRRATKFITVGPTFQAGWARGSNVILQPCGVS